MLDLRGNNLPKRQRELNNKVKEAIEKKVTFDIIKDENEATDVDKLFKIDLASNYRNIDYIIEILKSGDSLCISRALKCVWLYEDVNSNIINTDYLNDNIFPYMSLKMKKKMLTAVSMHMKNEERTISFYNYCINEKLTNIASKFLLLTSESFKLDAIKNGVKFDTIINEEIEYVMHFFGNSFTLLEAYLQTLNEWNIGPFLLKVRYFYSVSDVKYLDLLERFVKVEPNMKPDVLGLRISKSIMKKHKDRVLNKPSQYLYILNQKVLIKYSTVQDAKLFAIALLPSSASVFWFENYRRTNKYILDIIPKSELYAFLKKIFTDAYPNEEFEMNVNFFNYGFYEMLTVEEKEQWALRHIENEQEILGHGEDYKWYKFVNFDIALEGIKRYIMVTTDMAKRGEIINILVESAKTQRDLEKLLKYFYERHVNENPSVKEQFMNTIIQNHNVFEFEEDCWNAFNKILYSMEIYSPSGYFYMTDFGLIVSIYSIVNCKPVPEQLKDVFYSRFNYLYTDKLTEEKGKMLYDYLLKLYIKKVEEFEDKNYDDDVKKSVRRYSYMVLCVMEIFEKSKEDCPKLIMKYIKMDWQEFQNHRLFKKKVEIKDLQEYDLIRLLKKDATFLNTKFIDLKSTMNRSYTFRLNQLMRKLKIYFSKDIAKEFLSFFTNLLSDPKIIGYVSIYTSVYCIIQLADEKFIVDFMCKYAPLEPKIDHENVDRNLLYIRQAICRFSCYSRPPVPLSNVLMYLKGDYVHYCLPMFNHYFAHLPRPLSLKFVEAVLNAPLSIQKHGLRLAFKSYSAEILKKLVLSVWKKTKNVSLRLILYKCLFQKILNADEASQKELYKALKVLTSELRDDDNNDIFDLILSDQLPKNFRGDYLETAWTSVSKLREKGANIERQAKVLRTIKTNITLMDRDFLMEYIVKPHIHEMLIEKKIRPSYKSREISERVKTKWELVAKFIVTIENEETSKTSIDLVTSIIKTCAEMWDEVHDERYTIRLFCTNFISSLRANSNAFFRNFKYVNCIFERVLFTILEVLPSQEIYLTIWDLWLVIVTRKVCSKMECDENGLFKNVEYEKTCNDYANEIGNLIVDLVNKEQFYRSFLPHIAQVVNSHISVFSRAIKECVDMVRITICNHLTQFKLPEIYLLVLMLLPTDCPHAYFDTCKDTLQKIKELDDNEIQSYLYQKFLREDFKRRKFL